MILLKGLLLGLLIAIPVGPIGVLCVQRTLNKGKLSGFISGLGAATADAFYGAVAAFGLIIISGFLIKYQLIIRIIGGIFLVYIGIKSFYSKPKEIKPNEKVNDNPATDYISTFFLTITNPTTVISFTLLFAGIGLEFSNKSFNSSIFLVLGVFLGSALWWLILSFGVELIRSKVKNFSLEMVNKVAGVIITLSALPIIISAIFISRLQ
jgi:threonine/homoserine/homoserine lactone efflux protein